MVVEPASNPMLIKGFIGFCAEEFICESDEFIKFISGNRCVFKAIDSVYSLVQGFHT